jgi:hypothetical protein
MSRSATFILVVALLVLVLGIPWWPLGWRGSAYWSTAGALATVLAAVGAGVYVMLTYWLWRETATQREGSLMLRLIDGYDRLRRDIDVIQLYYMRCAESGPTDPIACFREELAATPALSPKDPVKILDDCRYRVSRFFVRTRKLVRAGFLSKSVVVAALDRRAIEFVFLRLVDPLDEAKAGKNFKTEDREFYTALLRYYSKEDDR